MDHAEVLDRLETAFLSPGSLPALHSDDSEEARAVRAHLAICSDCAVEHRAWQLAGVAMGANVPETLKAPTGARERTLAAVAMTGALRPAGATSGPLGELSVSNAGPHGPSAPAAPVPPARPATPRPGVLAIAAAFAAALFLAGAVLGGPLGLVSREAPDTSVADAQAAAVASAVDRVLKQPEHMMVPLVDAAGSTGGSILFDPASRELVVVSQSLESIPEGREYGCYLEREGQRIRVGRLKVVGDAAYWMGPMDEPADAGRSGDRFVVVRDDRPEAPVLSGGF
ncbi:MAG: hypothetical protein M3452_07310 [Chloroflexota bacterium]|nr:hypothetical protein [Chloroflexota bacterium]